MSSEILGYDCEGKPLRAGDRVVVVCFPGIKPKRIGARGVVIGLEKDPSVLSIAALHGVKGPLIEYEEDGGGLHTITDCYLRVIPQQETGDWSEIHKQTGWKPGKEVSHEAEKTS